MFILMYYAHVFSTLWIQMEKNLCYYCSKHTLFIEHHDLINFFFFFFFLPLEWFTWV